MGTLYVLQNQHGYFLKKVGADKSKEWVDGQDAGQLFRTVHKDEALNMLVETNSQNVELRITVKDYENNGKNHPIIPSEELPPPLPKPTPDNGANEESKNESPTNTETPAEPSDDVSAEKNLAR
jgi:hypothetical protein